MRTSPRDAKLALAYDRDALIRSTKSREASYLTTADVTATICSAIADKRPLSVIRLGDGEARFLAYMDPSLRRRLSTDEAEAIGESIWPNWFGESLAKATPVELVQLQAALVRSIRDAGVLGIPLSDRLQVDAAHFGYLAYLDQFASTVAATSGVRLADAFLNIRLHEATPFYRSLLGGLPFLGVISPHAELAQRLGGYLGIERVAEYLIPGEMQLPPSARQAVPDKHFPHVYRRLLAEIAVPERGSVFLVAAGVLGKVYCDRIAERGGIAIDIGSVADAWMGFRTRPGQYGDAQAWTLPPVTGK